MGQVLDYSAGRIPAAAIRRAGYAGVVRYVGSPGRQKNITGPEWRELQAGGVPVALVFERGATNTLGGRTQGQADARAVLADLTAQGIRTRGVYFAVDFDAQPAQFATIRAYFGGAGSVMPQGTVDGYGSARMLGDLFDAGLITRGWQTAAWSHGRHEPRAAIYQRIGQVAVAGVECDVSDIEHDDWGQYPHEGDDMLTDADKNWITRTVRDAARYYSVRGAQVMVAGHGNAAYTQDEVPAGESVRDQLAVVRGQLAGITTAVGQLAAGGGLDAGEIQAAAEAGARAALAELGHTLTGQTP